MITIENSKKLAEINLATLRLFKTCIVDHHNKDIANGNSSYDTENLEHGFFITTEIQKSYSPSILKNIAQTVSNLYGYDVEHLNNAFHKSFHKVAEASDEQLVLEQILHYLTTYGLESIGEFNNSTIFIPIEELNLSEKKRDYLLTAEKPFQVTVIKGMLPSEVYSHVMDMITSGIALSQQTVNDIMLLIKNLEFNDIDISSVKNKEIRSCLYVLYDTVPKNATEFLRFVISKSTNSSLIIKNDAEFYQIKHMADKSIINDAFTKYVEHYKLSNLAQSFYRYKMLWLAMKTSVTAPYINKMRRLAIKYNKPAKIGILDTLTSSNFNESDDNISMLKKELKKITIYKKFSILNAISYRLSNPKSIAYKVRNGKIYAKENNQKVFPSLKIYNIVLFDIINSLKKNVTGKTFYIPKNITYAVPTSEKMFLGGIPYGSTIKLGKRAIVGVHWMDLNGRRTDLDLHCSSNNEKYGWDCGYRNDDRSVLFSGDLTSASGDSGATEAYYFSEKLKDSSYILDLNFFNSWINYVKGETMPYELIIDTPDANRIDLDYLISGMSMLSHLRMEMKQKQESMGFLFSDTTGNKSFTFMKFGSGYSSTICSRNKGEENHLYNFMVDSIKTQATFNDLLVKAGAVVINDENEYKNSLQSKLNEAKANFEALTSAEKENSEKDYDKEIIGINNSYVDLSMSKLTKDTFISLIS